MHPNCIPVFDSKEDNVKSPAKVQLNTSTHNSTGFTLVHGVNISITEIKSFRHSLTLVNPCWLLQINSLSFIHAEMSLICNYLADRAKDKSLPSQIFLSLLEDGYEVFLFHVIMNLLLKNRIFQRPQRTAFK